MAIINAQLTSTQLDLIGNYLSTDGVPVGKTIAITNILVCNTSLVDSASFDMHLVPNTKAVSNDITLVIRELLLPPKETFTFDSERIVLNEGDKVVFVAQPDLGNTLTTLAATISYLEL